MVFCHFYNIFSLEVNFGTYRFQYNTKSYKRQVLFSLYLKNFSIFIKSACTSFEIQAFYLFVENDFNIVIFFVDFNAFNENSYRFPRDFIRWKDFFNA